MAQQPLWTQVDREIIISQSALAHVTPHKAAYYHLNFNALVELMQGNPAGGITIPFPDGRLLSFQSQWAPAAEEAYYQRHPLAGTYKVTAMENSSVQGRIDHTVAGFHAMIQAGEKTIMIDPVFKNRTDYYAVYYSDQYWPEGTSGIEFECLTDHSDEEVSLNLPELSAPASLRSAPVDQVVYRMAVATTGEYAQHHGGTVPLVSAEILTVMNRVNGIFERDNGATLQLIGANDVLIFLDPVNDGYANGDPGTMIDQNPARINATISSASYDIGHVFGKALGGGVVGLAELGCVCKNSKARGVSSLFTPQFDPFIINVVAHEIGHQFAATHSFNKCTNENPGTGWEPGGGSTIMSYSGSCGSNSVQGSADPYYHGGSIQQMRNFINSGSGITCGNRIPTDNEPPTVDLPYDGVFYAPISTPFKLAASASDLNADNLTYCWEGMDTGPITDAGSPVNTSPLFRSFSPVSDSFRYFPQINRVAFKTSSKFEYLPDYSREMNFRVTVRDNNPLAGGAVQKDVRFFATEQAGPFQVTSQNVAQTLSQFDYVEVTWDVANTNQPPVNSQYVNIRLSTNGGLLFPHLLAEKVPNNGSFWVTIPEISTTSGRIMVEAADNIFYNMSLNNFSVTPPAAPTFGMNIQPFIQVACVSEIVPVRLRLDPSAAFSESVSLEVLSGLPDGAVATFDNPNPNLPAEVVLSIDLSQVKDNGLFEVVVQATTPSGILILRPFVLDVVRSNYETLDAILPVSGASGLGSSPFLEWTPQEDADTYRLEVATNPAFGNSVVLEVDQLQSPFYQITQLLDLNTLFYWRVIPQNRCGLAEEVPVFVFHTASINCTEFSNNTSYQISASGTPTVISSIDLTALDGNVGTLYIPKMTGNHTSLGQLRATLRSPDGTTARLFTGQCGVISTQFNMGFNDESAIPYSCPPNTGMVYIPQDDLSVFQGKSIKGLWNLEVLDFVTGNGGNLNSWTLSLCSDVSFTNPYFLERNTLIVGPGKSKQVLPFNLNVTDNETDPWNLVFNLVRLPRKGALNLEGLPLELGQTFTMQDIHDGKLSYQEITLVEGEDDFLFTVENGNSGWLGIASLPILIDKALSNQPSSVFTPTLRLAPNPARDETELRMDWPFPASSLLTIYNSQGLMLQQHVLPGGLQSFRFNTHLFPAGFYIVVVETPHGRYAEKLQVIH
jgi:hypothetical protein